VWKADEAVLIRWEDIPIAERVQLHFNFPHETGKPDDPLGRFLVDPSNVPEGFCALNSPEAKAMSDEMYGVVSSPTIRDIYTNVYAYCDTHNLSPRDCLLWKDDISGAFPQFRWTSSSALLMALMID
jgi:hypothetical protein